MHTRGLGRFARALRIERGEWVPFMLVRGHERMFDLAKLNLRIGSQLTYTRAAALLQVGLKGV